MSGTGQCPGCRQVLSLPPGVTKFSCPKCHMPQVLPDFTIRPSPEGDKNADNTKMQLPCANCHAILNVPPGINRFQCPQCRAELATDPEKVAAYRRRRAMMQMLTPGGGMPNFAPNPNTQHAAHTFNPSQGQNPPVSNPSPSQFQLPHGMSNMQMFAPGQLGSPGQMLNFNPGAMGAANPNPGHLSSFGLFPRPGYPLPADTLKQRLSDLTAAWTQTGASIVRMPTPGSTAGAGGGAQLPPKVVEEVNEVGMAERVEFQGFTPGSHATRAAHFGGKASRRPSAPESGGQ
eukprot:jgi/Mesen1/5409/ME000269S04557